MSKEQKTEKRILEYKGDTYTVQGAFQHQYRKYITIDVLDENNVPYTICDKHDTLYDKIKKIKV